MSHDGDDDDDFWASVDVDFICAQHQRTGAPHAQPSRHGSVATPASVQPLTGIMPSHQAAVPPQQPGCMAPASVGPCGQVAGQRVPAPIAVQGPAGQHAVVPAVHSTCGQPPPSTTHRQPQLNHECRFQHGPPSSSEQHQYFPPNPPHEAPAPQVLAAFHTLQQEAVATSTAQVLQQGQQYGARPVQYNQHHAGVAPLTAPSATVMPLQPPQPPQQHRQAGEAYHTHPDKHTHPDQHQRQCQGPLPASRMQCGQQGPTAVAPAAQQPVQRPLPNAPALQQPQQQQHPAAYRAHYGQTRHEGMPMAPGATSAGAVQPLPAHAAQQWAQGPLPQHQYMQHPRQQPGQPHPHPHQQHRQPFDTYACGRQQQHHPQGYQPSGTAHPHAAPPFQSGMAGAAGQFTHCGGRGEQPGEMARHAPRPGSSGGSAGPSGRDNHQSGASGTGGSGGGIGRASGTSQGICPAVSSGSGVAVKSGSGAMAPTAQSSGDQVTSNSVGAGLAGPMAGAACGNGGGAGSITFTAVVGLESATHLFIKIGSHDFVRHALRGVMGISFDTKDPPRWVLPRASFKAAQKALNHMTGLKVVWEDLPELVTRVLNAAESAPNDLSRYSRLQQQPLAGGSTLEERMMEFQKEGVQFALRKGGRVLIGDEMGLGKTVQACALLRCYQEEWPALIMVPSSLRGQWGDALKNWLELSDSDIKVLYNAKDVDKLDGIKVGVIGYDLLRKSESKLQAIGFKVGDERLVRIFKPKVVVADEAHYIKNHTSARCKAALPLLQKSKRVVLLSGTPALSRPAELITLLQATLPSAKVSSTAFAARYCEGDAYSAYTGAKNLDELNRLITGCIMIRRRKAEVLPQLPAKRRQQVFLSLAPEDSAKIQRHSNELAAVSSMGLSISEMSTEQMLQINRLYVATAEAKVKAVQEYVKCMLEGNEDSKFLVFAHHKILLDGVESAVSGCKVRSIRIDGSTNTRTRDDLRRQFQEDPATRVAVLSIKAAGTGLTLTAASTVLFAELTYVPGDIQQAEDRVHRIGQTNSVNIQFLMARSSIDEIIWETIQSKLDTVGKALDGKQDSLKVASQAVNQAPQVQQDITTYMCPQDDTGVGSIRPQNTGYSPPPSPQNQDGANGGKQISITRFFRQGNAHQVGCSSDAPAAKRARMQP